MVGFIFLDNSLLKLTPMTKLDVKRILLVDDEPPIVEYLARKIKQVAKYDTIIANNGQEAIQLLQENSVHLVITDLVMPYMGGIELLKTIRKRWSQIPVVILTGYGTLHDAIEAVKYGASNFILKPFDMSELFAVIEKIFSMMEEQEDTIEVINFVNFEDISFTIPNSIEAIRQVVHLLMQKTSRYWNINRDDLMDLHVCLYEALVNAYEHGNLEVDSQLKHKIHEDPTQSYEVFLIQRAQTDPYKDKKIYVEFKIDQEKLVCKVIDEGNGFNFLNLDNPLDPDNMLKAAGRGLMLIHSMVDDVKFNDSGNSITLTKKR